MAHVAHVAHVGERKRSSEVIENRPAFIFILDLGDEVFLAEIFECKEFFLRIGLRWKGWRFFLRERICDKNNKENGKR